MTLQEKRNAFVDALAMKNKWPAGDRIAQANYDLAHRALVAALDAPQKVKITPEGRRVVDASEYLKACAPSEPSPAVEAYTVETLLREALDQIWSKPPEGKGWNYCREQFGPLISRALSQSRSERERHEEMAERVRRAVEWIRAHYMTEPCGCGAPPTSKIVTTLLPILEGGRDKEATEK